MNRTIKKVTAREIIDSRGNPTVEVDVVLEDGTLFSYKCDNLYDKASESGLRFDDPALGITWPRLDVPVRLSAKDGVLPLLSEIQPWKEA